MSKKGRLIQRGGAGRAGGRAAAVHDRVQAGRDIVQHPIEGWREFDGYFFGRYTGTA